MTVRTFHGLGMAIIGEAEGKRPALAATAENDRALFDLLKGIVADLLADGELSVTLHEWFQAGFAPYRSEHEFRNWSEYHDYIRKFDIRSLKGETVRSYEQAEGRLLRNLTEKLAAHGVTISPIPREDVFTALEQQGRIDPFTQLVATFLRHFKGSRLSLAEITERAAAHRDRERAQAFLAVFQPIFERYQEALARSGEIDFHDMINRATDLVETGRYRSPFGYILVDEFQDISPSRARLLKALLDSSPGSQLFAVGDDWQAIYRFGGSDIAVMREFRDHFGAFQRIDLATTFRCADRIAAVATDFVLHNPAQLRKTVCTTRKADRPAVYVGLPSQDLSLLKEAIDRIAEDARRHDGTSEVLLLGRYRHLRPRNLHALPKQYPGLRFTWMTVHRSKGLEADYAVVLGLCSGKHGSRRDRRRSAARSGAGGARSPSERRGATPALRCRHPGETAGFPACRRWSAGGVRDGVDRWRKRSRGIRPSAGGRRILSAMHRRTAGAPRERPRRERLLRLFELSALRVHRTCLSSLRKRPSRQVRQRLPLPRLWRGH